MSERILLEEQRENWGTRAGFVLAAIGSAVGLGNLWGFPYKLYAYGGGAFLVPYLAAMMIIGIPVLVLEFSLGHMSQRAAPVAFRRAGRRKEMVGWWGIVLGFVIITYYPVILAWCLSFFGRSVEGILHHNGELPWAAHGGKEAVAKTAGFFLNDYCNIWTGAEGVKPWSLGSLKPEIVMCLAGVWMLMFLCICRGVKLVSKVVLWTVPLPWLMLLILTVRGLTLEGASEGMAYYLNPDWSQLLKPTTWRFAFGQVFFSMSLAFGVMITYASFLHRKSDINNNAMIVGLGDLGTSFVAGIAVFATLGAMSVAATIPVGEVIGEGTVGLSFIAFPYALAQLPHSAWFGLIFFFALITLGIDSAFSITESVLASIVDKTGWNRTATLWGMTFVGFFCGLFYCSRGGLTWLEDIDGLINGPWGIALLGLIQCLVLGWLFRLSRLRRHANERSDWKLGMWWDWIIRVVAPVLLSALFIWSMYDTVSVPDKDTGDVWMISGDGSVKIPVVVAVALAALAPILAIVLSCIKSRTEAQGTLRRSDEPVGPDQPPQRLGPAMAVAGLIASAFAVVVTIAAQLRTNAGVELTDGLAWGIPAAIVVIVACSGMVCSSVAIVMGSLATVRADRYGHRPHWTAQLGGIGGTLGAGFALGISMALYVLYFKIEGGAVSHTSELKGSAFLMMALMLAIIVVGLGWCFYRAIKAAGVASSGRNQPPKEMNGQ